MTNICTKNIFIKGIMKSPMRQYTIRFTKFGILRTKVWEKPSLLSQRLGYIEEYVEEARIYFETETAEFLLDSILSLECLFASRRLRMSAYEVSDQFEKLKKDFSVIETEILENTQLSHEEKKGLLNLQKNLINFHSQC